MAKRETSKAKKPAATKAKPSKQSRHGPRPWAPTKQEREQVMVMVAMGMTQEQIGLVMQKSTDSLQRHCRHELDTGVMKANALVAGELFKAVKAGDKASIFFWLKTRAGWRETHRHEHVGDGGGAIETVNLNRDMTAKEAAERYKEKLG